MPYDEWKGATPPEYDEDPGYVDEQYAKERKLRHAKQLEESRRRREKEQVR